MHKPVIQQKRLPLATRGLQIDIFLCAFAVVQNWDNPVLRNAFWRCYLPITGGASVRSSRRTWPMRAHEALIIPPECPVVGHAEGPFTLYFAHFTCPTRLKKSTPVAFAVSPDIREALDRAVARADEHLFRLAMLQLVTSALIAIPAINVRTPLTDERTELAYRIMREHMDTRVTNAELAKALNMSEPSLLRLFRRVVGTSPQKEHLRMRLNHAAELLRNSDRGMDDIAAECGFWDRNHFSRAFAREWKTPPAQYRRTATRL